MRVSSHNETLSQVTLSERKDTLSWWFCSKPLPLSTKYSHWKTTEQILVESLTWWPFRPPFQQTTSLVRCWDLTGWWRCISVGACSQASTLLHMAPGRSGRSGPPSPASLTRYWSILPSRRGSSWSPAPSDSRPPLACLSPAQGLPFGAVKTSLGDHVVVCPVSIIRHLL